MDLLSNLNDKNWQNAEPDHVQGASVIAIETVAPERIWKWGAPVRREIGGPIWRKVPEKYFFGRAHPLFWL